MGVEERSAALGPVTSHDARLAALRARHDRIMQRANRMWSSLQSTQHTIGVACALLAETHLRLGDRGSQWDESVEVSRPRAPAQVTKPAASWPIDGATSQRCLASDAGPSSQPLAIVLVAADPGRLQPALAALQRSAVPNRLYVFPNTDEAGQFLLRDGDDRNVPETDLTSLGRAGPAGDGREPRGKALRILDLHDAPLMLAPPDRLAPPVPDRESARTGLADSLSPREREVLGMLARRFSNKEIAAVLRVSWRTVAKHTGNLYQKLQVTSRRDAVARAAALGLLPAALAAAAHPEPAPQRPLLFRPAPRIT